MNRMTRRLAGSLVVLTLSPAASRAVAAQQVDHAEHHEFVIPNFATESGVTLPRAVVVYGTYVA